MASSVDFAGPVCSRGSDPRRNTPTRLAPHAETPWRGVPPLAAAPATMALVGLVERQLTRGARGARGTPADGAPELLREGRPMSGGLA